MQNEAKIKQAVNKLYDASYRLSVYVQSDEANQDEVRDFLSVISEYTLAAAAELSPKADLTRRIMQ